MGGGDLMYLEKRVCKYVIRSIKFLELIIIKNDNNNNLRR